MNNNPIFHIFGEVLFDHIFGFLDRVRYGELQKPKNVTVRV
ncbi:MAG: hypothetical protein WC685_04125 [Methylobacter sp.]|jgi:hypothetical protein